MKSLQSKFENLVRNLNYSKLQIARINAESVKRFCIQEMPEVVSQLEDLRWTLSDDKTWLETVFVNVCMHWYDKRIALYITSSAVDFNLAKKVFSTRTFAKFRAKFKLDAHAAVLINPVIFLEAEDLDSIYINFDFDKGYSAIDFSHYDENDVLEETYENDWGWLENTDEEAPEWTHLQLIKAFN